MPPRFLYDRCLPSTAARTLRQAGFDIITLEELYGRDVAQLVADADWIEHAGRNGWPALTKDNKIRYVAAELGAVRKHDAVLFALRGGNLNIREIAAAFLAAGKRMVEIVESTPGASIWSVYRDGQVEPRWRATRDT